jgi:hypothetical protein
MKNKGKKLLMLLCFIVLLVAGCGQAKAPPEIVPTQKFASDEFTDAGMCQYCHLEIYQQWAGSMHALSFTDSLYLSQASQVSERSNGESDVFCAGCHTPVGMLAEEVPPAGGSSLSAVARQGVSCDFCHVITAADSAADPFFRVTPGKTKYGPFADPIHTPLHESEYLELYTKSEYCGMCHDIEHPEHNLILGATYSEWKASTYASKKIQCQDCHMTPGPGVTKPNPGVAATGAPKMRDHTWTHTMSGANIFAHQQAGFSDHAQQAEENLKSAATLFLGLPESLSPYQSARINVRIRNSGAGHYLPTGLTMFTEMWLEVVLTDSQGRVVYQSGVMDENGSIPSESTLYKTRLQDAAGKETTDLWAAVSVLSDRRIPPQGYVDEYFDIPGMPLPDILQVKARLLYRSISQTEANRLPGVNGSRAPVVEMAVITGSIPVK